MIHLGISQHLLYNYKSFIFKTPLVKHRIVYGDPENRWLLKSDPLKLHFGFVKILNQIKKSYSKKDYDVLFKKHFVSVCKSFLLYKKDNTLNIKLIFNYLIKMIRLYDFKKVISFIMIFTLFTPSISLKLIYLFYDLANNRNSNVE